MGSVRFDLVEGQQQRGGSWPATTVNITTLRDGALRGERDHGHGSMPYTGGGDSVVAQSDERWSWWYGGLDRLYIRLGLMVSRQQLMAAQLSQSCKAFEQVMCDQQVMAKELEKIEGVVAQQNHAGLKEMTPPIGGQELELMSDGVLTFSPTMCSARQVFVGMPDQYNMHQMLKGVPTSQPEIHTLGTSMVAEDAVVSVLDEISFKKVVWDEMLSNCNTHIGLLQELATGAEYLFDEEIEPITKLDADDKLSHVTGVHLPLELSMDTAYEVFDGMPPSDVVWDDMPTNQDIRHGLLVELAQGGEYHVDETPLEDVRWDEEFGHDVDCCDGLLDQITQHTGHMVEEEVKSIVGVDIDDEFRHVSGDLLHMDVVHDVFETVYLANEVAEKSDQVAFMSSLVWDRDIEETLNLERKFFDAKILTAAAMVQNRSCTAYPIFKSALLAVGVKWEEVYIMTKCVVQCNLVTAATYDSHPEFIGLFFKVLGGSVAGSNKRVLFLCWEYTEDYEVLVPFQSLHARGSYVDHVCQDKGARDKCLTAIHDFEDGQNYGENPNYDFNLTKLESLSPSTDFYIFQAVITKIFMLCIGGVLSFSEHNIPQSMQQKCCGWYCHNIGFGSQELRQCWFFLLKLSKDQQNHLVMLGVDDSQDYVFIETVGQYSKCMLQGYTMDQFLKAVSNVLTVGLLVLSVKPSFQIEHWAHDDHKQGVLEAILNNAASDMDAISSSIQLYVIAVSFLVAAAMVTRRAELKVCAVKATGFGDSIRDNLGDIAVMTRGKCYEQPEIYMEANFSMRIWDPGIQNFELNEAFHDDLLVHLQTTEQHQNAQRWVCSTWHDVAWG